MSSGGGVPLCRPYARPLACRLHPTTVPFSIIRRGALAPDRKLARRARPGASGGRRTGV